MAVMRANKIQKPIQTASLPSRALAEQVLSRTAGAPLVPGNRVRLLKDAAENYPAWIKALEGAKKFIHFESYIIHGDDIGWQFAEILIRKAKEGVIVRVLYDWVGGLGKTPRRFWKKLRAEGVEVRCFNPPRLESPLSWVTRDHRKMIGVDGRIAYVTGLCVGRMWVGYPDRKIEPWRDTGIEIVGPAVADVERSFAEVWAVTGAAVPTAEIPARDSIGPQGDISLRIIATVPNTAGMYRLDQLIAALARRTLWLTDAYFIGSTAYIQGLRSAARDGVDVRLLVPGATDIPILRAISRAGYQPLLESGVRVFEWNGSMIHAKTAVADGRWARVGSTNLNISSWMGNYELDAAMEDRSIAQSMEEMYQEDLQNSTEILLRKGNRVQLAVKRKNRLRRMKQNARGSVGRAGAGAIRIGNTLGAAITNHRVLGPAEARITGIGGFLLLLLALIGVFLPRGLSIPLAVVCGWLAVSFLIRTYKLAREAKMKEKDDSSTRS
ncbi:MAG: cardiolipin synthetase [Deltaproteobacteria bacterium]|nr:cardiolipin synthetase [Deltaproteobacteria bacterium]